MTEFSYPLECFSILFQKHGRFGDLHIRHTFAALFHTNSHWHTEHQCSFYLVLLTWQHRNALACSICIYIPRSQRSLIKFGVVTWKTVPCARLQARLSPEELGQSSCAFWLLLACLFVKFNDISNLIISSFKD